MKLKLLNGVKIIKIMETYGIQLNAKFSLQNGCETGDKDLWVKSGAITHQVDKG